MSLSSSLYSAISGLSNLGDSMTVIGDNIANINTVGFKASRTSFEDVMVQAVATATGTAQVGRGTALSDITASFTQGSFESTGLPTDLGIVGEGFFVIRDPDSETQDNYYYTRAGNFKFDKDGNLVNPADYIAMGWQLENNGDDTGLLSDIVVSSFTSPPSETDEMTVVINLNSNAVSKSATLYSAWDAQGTDSYISDAAYEQQAQGADKVGECFARQ